MRHTDRFFGYPIAVTVGLRTTTIRLGTVPRPGRRVLRVLMMYCNARVRTASGGTILRKKAETAVLYLCYTDLTSPSRGVPSDAAPHIEAQLPPCWVRSSTSNINILSVANGPSRWTWCTVDPPAQKQILYMTKPSPVRIYSSAPPSEGKEIPSSLLGERRGKIPSLLGLDLELKTEIPGGHGRLLDPEPADI